MHRLMVGVVLVASAVAACVRGNSRPTARDRAPASARTRASPYDTIPPDMQAARGLAGCYRLTVGPWSDARALGGQIAIPPHLHLDTARQERRQPGFELVAQAPGSGVPRGTGWPPVWSPVGADSLQVRVWANQTSSVNLFLRRRAGRTLHGTARYFWDQVALDPVTKRWLWEQYPTAPATLSSEPCS